MKYKFAAFFALLSFAVFVNAVEQPIPAAPKTAAQADALHAKHDKNKDGKLSKDEAKMAGMTDEQIKKADTNKDGFIDGKEYKVAIVICC